MQTTVKTLYKQGYSKSHIARVLSVDRKTVRKIISSFNDGDEELKKKPHPLFFEEYREYIEIQLGKGLYLGLVSYCLFYSHLVKS